MTIRYTPEARNDLRAIENYIANTLCNPLAANNVITNILKKCSYLKEQPNMGIELSKKTKKDTDMRYVVCGRYIVFYKVEEMTISIIRILDSKIKDVQILFHRDIV